MFNQLKQLSQLKSFQDKIKKEKFELSKSGVKVIVNGNLMIEEIVLLDSAVQGEDIKNCINECLKQAQVELAKKLSMMQF